MNPLPAVTAFIDARNTAPPVVKTPVATVPWNTFPVVRAVAESPIEVPVVLIESVSENGIESPPPPPPAASWVHTADRLVPVLV